LPNGIFSKQKSQFGQILEGLAMEDVGICMLWLFGLLYGYWGYFMGIWYINSRLHVKLRKNLFAEILFAENNCLILEEMFI
jgi:hypothetical protein